MDKQSVAIARAVEVFVRGVAFTRSFTHPYVAERVGSLWVMRDGPRKRGNYRTEGWGSVDSAPETVDTLVRAAARGRYVICALCAPPEPFDRLRDRYKALGYRLLTTEPLMVHNPRADSVGCNGAGALGRIGDSFE